MRRRGFTAVELILAMFVMGFVMVGSLAVFGTSLKSYFQTRTDIEMTDDSALALRGMAESLQGAYSVEVKDQGLTVEYYMPKFSDTIDPATLNYELIYPLESDGSMETYKIADGKLIRSTDGRVLAENIVLIDPDPSSSGFNTAYVPFELTTIGSMDALKMNLITEDEVRGEARYVRMRTTVLIRNSQ